jgi:uncharacterized membrane protein YsdA (DUF1294 family)
MDWNSGMALGLAAILIFAMYLIDKHGAWRRTLEIALGLLTIGLVVGGSLFVLYLRLYKGGQ